MAVLSALGEEAFERIVGNDPDIVRLSSPLSVTQAPLPLPPFCLSPNHPAQAANFLEKV